MNPIRVAEGMVIAGLGAQGWALYELAGVWVAMAVVGTEVACLGLLGLLRAVQS